MGEPINPKAWLWYWKVIGGERCPIVDTWWQTETGAIMITTLPGAQYAKPGSAGQPLPGIDAAVVDDRGQRARPTSRACSSCAGRGRGCCAPSTRTTTASSRPTSRRFGKETYLVGDAARKDDDDYFWIIGRIDDVINVSGHRLSTAEVESAIVSHAKVAEAAVIGQADEDTGQAIVRLRHAARATSRAPTSWSTRSASTSPSASASSRARKRIIWADDLPKTRSGKIMRRLLRDIAEGRELGDVTTLRDPTIMDELKQKVAERADSEE